MFRKIIRALTKAAPIIFLLISVSQLAQMDWVTVKSIFDANINFWFSQYFGWAAILILSAAFLLADIRHKNIPITVKEAKIKIVYDDLAGKNVTVTYTYLFRANHYDVDAIPLYQSASSEGQIPRQSIKASIHGHNVSNKQETILHKKDNGWEIIRSLEDESLPTQSLWDWVLNRNLEYECSANFLNSFQDKEYEYYDFEVKHVHSYKKIIFELHVPKDLHISECKFYQKNSSSLKYDDVQEATSEVSNRHKKYYINKNIPSHRLTTFRLLWKQV